MEYLAGETLYPRLDRGAIPLAQVFRPAIEMAAALHHSHRAGIIHRDFKPANILITQSGVKLLDFGVAKWSDREPVRLGDQPSGLADELPETQSLTAEGTIVGTLQYMAPEQLEGRKTDARADLFAFGAILYEM